MQKLFHQNIAYLALGSNLGNRISNFNKCIKMINMNKIGKIEKTSQIYESPCLDEYNNIVKEENRFLNSVIRIRTDLSPYDLLRKCKEIEILFKRKPKEKYYEAREIDIDIILYNDEIIEKESEDKLYIPHMNMNERLFVLKPLLDIEQELECFNRNFGRQMKVKEILRNLLKNKYKCENYNIEEINKYDKIVYLSKTLNFLKNGEEVNFDLNEKSLLMGVVNCTPDSFSVPLLKNENLDKINSINSDSIYDKIIEMLVLNKDFINIIDIGGESTRPGAAEVDPNQEFERIKPLLEKIKNNQILKNKIISVDTRKSTVAKESIKLGANIINDVSGGLFDPEIGKICAENFVSYVCMHSRDNPEKMNRRELLTYDKGVVNGVNEEIEKRIDNMKSYINNDFNNCINKDINIPILDWNIIIDPGLGFSKNLEQNFEIIKNLEKIRNKFPNALLTGHSKKKFIQETLNVNKDNTLIGDVVIASACIEKGANIIRVHDYEKVNQAIKISDILYKQ